MNEKQVFGARLKRHRELHAVTLESLAARTKVGVALWEAIERGDTSGWPTGIFARAYIRAYAEAVDLDAESTVNEFCRWFPEGDRRGGPIIRATAEVIGVQPRWQDDLPPDLPHGDRRASAESPDGGRLLGMSREAARRTVSAGLDVSLIVLAAGSVTRFVGSDVWTTIALVSLIYHTIGVAAIGSSPGVVLERQLRRLTVMVRAFRTDERPIHAPARK